MLDQHATSGQLANDRQGKHALDLNFGTIDLCVEFAKPQATDCSEQSVVVDKSGQRLWVRKVSFADCSLCTSN